MACVYACVRVVRGIHEHVSIGEQMRKKPIERLRDNETRGSGGFDRSSTAGEQKDLNALQGHAFESVRVRK